MKKPHLPDPSERNAVLDQLRNLKMSESSHRYVRGSTEQFYKWLQKFEAQSVPIGPAIWICGDCHVGNLGPVANAQSHVEIQIRDLDQTVIGNPVYDLIRLALSLASAARSSDLPGVTTFLMMEKILEGYELAFAPDFDVEADLETPPSILASLRTSLHASWKTLARETIDDESPQIPLGKKFWPLSLDERDSLAAACETPEVRDLANLSKMRRADGKVKLVDAAYWVKGCSSLGSLRYVAVLSVERPKKRQVYCLMDFKEAVSAMAPRATDARMPQDDAERVLAGAKHLSPYLGKRMARATVGGRSMFVRELMPQDLKLNIDQLDVSEATKVAAYLGAVVGKAHSRQMNSGQRENWLSDLKKKRTPDLNAPAWLWQTVVALLSTHEKAYLEHCRQYALAS